MLIGITDFVFSLFMFYRHLLAWHLLFVAPKSKQKALFKKRRLPAAPVVPESPCFPFCPQFAMFYGLHYCAKCAITILLSLSLVFERLPSDFLSIRSLQNDGGQSDRLNAEWTQIILKAIWNQDAEKSDSSGCILAAGCLYIPNLKRKKTNQPFIKFITSMHAH